MSVPISATSSSAVPRAMPGIVSSSSTRASSLAAHAWAICSSKRAIVSSTASICCLGLCWPFAPSNVVFGHSYAQTAKCHPGWTTRPAQGASTAQSVGIRLPKCAAPAPDRRVGHDDPALGQQLLDVAVAEREAEIEPDRMANDRGREAVALVTGERCLFFHAPSIARRGRRSLPDSTPHRAGGPASVTCNCPDAHPPYLDDTLAAAIILLN